jgi:putative nucleotidyltransferase with HDIG domain
MDRIDQYLSRVDHLPPAPTLVVELLDLFKQPDRDLDRVVELIAHDPSLTAEVLKLCNSAFFGGDDPVDDMFTAVMRVGFFEVYRLVVGVFGANAIGRASAAGGPLAVQMWQHSVTAAVAAETLAERIQVNKGVAFTAALLHDIGQMVLASVEGPRYAQWHEKPEVSGQSRLASENAAFGLDHAQIGARLLARWNFPPNLVNAVSSHHDPIQGKPFERLAAIVNLANVIAYRISSDQGVVPVEFQDGNGVLSMLRLTADDLPDLVEQTKEGLVKVKALMGG